MLGPEQFGSGPPIDEHIAVKELLAETRLVSAESEPELVLDADDDAGVDAMSDSSVHSDDD